MQINAGSTFCGAQPCERTRFRTNARALRKAGTIFESRRKSEPFHVYNDAGSAHPFAAKRPILAGLNCRIKDGPSFCGAQGSPEVQWQRNESSYRIKCLSGWQAPTFDCGSTTVTGPFDERASIRSLISRPVGAALIAGRTIPVPSINSSLHEIGELPTTGMLWSSSM